MFIRIPPALLALPLMFLSAGEPRAADSAFAARSGEDKVAVLELYTSEGCSSCPPADRFVNGLPAAGYSPAQVIPLAFHVTYWDYIGWRDPYAQKAFDARQYAVAARQKRQGVYTPQLVLDGKNLRGTGDFAEQLRVLNAAAPAASIRVEGRGGDSLLHLDIDVRITDPARRGAAALYVARVESGLDSSVTAGENRGRRLRHDQVVRQWIGPLPLPAERADSRHSVTLDLPAAAGRGPTQLAVLVQNRDDGSVLQALSVPLAGKAGKL
jgi:hypothetical protein